MIKVYGIVCLFLIGFVLHAEDVALPPEKQLEGARAQIALLQSQVRFLQAQNQALIAQIEANKANENYRQIEAALTGDAACQLSDTQTIQCPEVQDAKNTSTSADSSPGAE